MNKDINYGGYTAVPSDYECADGELAMSLNLLPENSGINTLHQPATVFTLDQPDKDRVLCVHTVGDIPYYIVARSLASGLVDIIYYENGGYPQGYDHAPSIMTCRSVTTAVPLGNVLALTTDRGLQYAIFRDGTYTYLGLAPTMPTLEFALQLDTTLEDATTSKIQVDCEKETYEGLVNYLADSDGSGARRTHGRASDQFASSKETLFFEKLTNGLLGHLLSSYSKAVEKSGMMFYQPFMVRYAVRLYDGTYLYPSSPVLMLPTSIPPLIRALKGEWKDDTYSVPAGGGARFFSLLYRTLDSGDLGPSSDWREIISSVDIFISAPLYTYDQSKSVEGCGVLHYDETRSTGNRGRLSRSEAPAQALTHRIDGIYRDGPDSPVTIHYAPNDTDTRYWYLHSRESELLDDIRSCANFYLIASIDATEITGANASLFSPVPIDDAVTPDSLVARPRLTDDAIPYGAIYPELVTTYNKRLNIANLKIQLPDAPSLRSAMTYCDTDRVASTTVAMTYRKQWAEKTVCRYTAPLETFPDFSRVPPLFMYIPDPDVKSVDIYFNRTNADSTTSPCRYTLPFTPHDFLNGSYYLGSFYVPVDSDAMSPRSATPPVPTKALVSYPDKLYLSDVNNPFRFPAGLAIDFPGRIIGISSAAKALSQGQFGQFPLYAFTDSGVWATEVSATGSYSATQPITRDVCINPKAITQNDSAVLFPTDRGIMQIAGAETVCISEAINSEYPFDISTLPSVDRMFSLLGLSVNTYAHLAPFSTFLRDSAMIYDYVRQRIVVFNPAYHYAYVFSLRTHAWGMMVSSVAYTINSYPNALAVNLSGHVVDFTRDLTDAAGNVLPTFSILITRPLGLDIPDILKTVDNVIQRGNFSRGAIQSVLYGSRDLHTWSLVWTSTDHYLRGFSGTPYRYYRIALIGTLSPAETLTAASIQFTPHKTNQPR